LVSSGAASAAISGFEGAGVAQANIGEAQRAAVGNHEVFAESGRRRGGQQNGLRRLTIPPVESELCRLCGLIVTVGEEGKLSLVFVPCEPHVFALALGDSNRRRGITRLDDENSVLGVVARPDGVDELLAVVRQSILDDVGHRTLGAIGERADDQIRPDFGT
jgi:hypothetical protein